MLPRTPTAIDMVMVPTKTMPMPTTMMRGRLPLLRPRPWRRRGRLRERSLPSGRRRHELAGQLLGGCCGRSGRPPPLLRCLQVSMPLRQLQLLRRQELLQRGVLPLSSLWQCRLLQPLRLALQQRRQCLACDLPSQRTHLLPSVIPLWQALMRCPQLRGGMASLVAAVSMPQLMWRALRGVLWIRFAGVQGQRVLMPLLLRFLLPAGARLAVVHCCTHLPLPLPMQLPLLTRLLHLGGRRSPSPMARLQFQLSLPLLLLLKRTSKLPWLRPCWAGRKLGWAPQLPASDSDRSIVSSWLAASVSVSVPMGCPAGEQSESSIVKAERHWQRLGVGIALHCNSTFQLKGRLCPEGTTAAGNSIAARSPIMLACKAASA